MLYNLGQIRSQIAQYCGVRNTAGLYDFDSTTFPTIDLANFIINDSFREICGEYDYTFLESTKSYPFYHTIQDVQSINLFTADISGNNFASGTITPYPSDVLNFANTAENTVQDLANNFSGISYIGLSGTTAYSGISTSGVVSTGNWTGVGYTYQLNEDIDKFMVPGIYVPHSNNGNSAQGVMIKNIDYEDMIRIFPIGTIQASGTPIYFSEAPGLTSANSNGKSIVFGPAPVTDAYTGNNFVVFYKRKHIDMKSDTDIQSVIPEQWQNAAIKLGTAKIFEIADPSRTEAMLGQFTTIVRAMKLWDAKQPSKVRRWRDSNYDVNSSFLFDNSSWQPLGSWR